MAYRMLLFLLLSLLWGIESLSLTPWSKRGVQPRGVLFDPLPSHNESIGDASPCGGTILSDTLPRLRVERGAGVNSTDKLYLEQSITFKHTRGETLCFKTQLKEEDVLYRTNQVRVHVPAQYGDVHRRHVRLSSRRAAEVTASVGVYRHPGDTPSQQHRVMEHLQQAAHEGARHLVHGVSLRRENQYAREDWCTFYYWWNRQREHVHLIELEGPLVSEITYVIASTSLNSSEATVRNVTVSTEGQAYNPGHLGIKHLKVTLPNHPLQTHHHYVVPSSLPQWTPSAHMGHNRTVPLFYGDRSVNHPDEFASDKAFFIDDPYQYPRFLDSAILPEIIRPSQHAPLPHAIPRTPSTLPLYYEKGPLSGLVWNPFPSFRAFLGHVGDSTVSKLAAAPSEVRYDLDLGFPFITGLRNEDQRGQMVLETTFSLLEEVVSTEVLSGAVASVACHQAKYTSVIQQDAFLRCNASDVMVAGPLQFNVYTPQGKMLWHQMLPVRQPFILFDVPLHILGDTTTVHVCSKHGICAVVDHVGRPKDMLMVHLNTPGLVLGGHRATDAPRDLQSGFARFWEQVKAFFVRAWQWVQQHVGWVSAAIILIGGLLALYFCRRCLSCFCCGGKSTKVKTVRADAKYIVRKA